SLSRANPESARRMIFVAGQVALNCLTIPATTPRCLCSHRYWSGEAGPKAGAARQKYTAADNSNGRSSHGKTFLPALRAKGCQLHPNPTLLVGADPRGASEYTIG